MFQVKIGDITRLKVDAIVNSLGPDARVFGKVCRAIVNAANSDEINAVVESPIINQFLDTFLTNAGELPSKHVIHIVTPYKWEDDENNSMLQKAYERIFEIAIENGFKSIAFPLLGGGFNGYSDEDSLDAYNEATYKYMSDESFDMDVFMVRYKASGFTLREELKKSEKRALPLEAEPKTEPFELDISYYETFKGPTDQEEVEEAYKKNLIKKLESLTLDGTVKHIDHPEDVLLINKVFSLAKEEELLTPKYPILVPMHYVDEFVSTRKKAKKELIMYYTSKTLSKWRALPNSSDKKIMRKKDALSIIVITHMPMTNALQFLSYCGFSFDSTSRLDRGILTYLLDGSPELPIYSFSSTYGLDDELFENI